MGAALTTVEMIALNGGRLVFASVAESVKPDADRLIEIPLPAS
jgi:hypothetical protein